MNSSVRVIYVALAMVLASGLAIGPLAAAPGETISLAFSAGYKEDVLRANISKFEQETGIQVQIDASPYGDLYKKTLLSLSTSASRYDVLFLDELWIPGFAPYLKEISLVVGPDGVEELSPATTVVSFLTPDRPFDQDVIMNFCHFVHFFTSPETAEKWTTEHPGTFVLSVEDAHVLGHLTIQRNGGDALRG